MIFWDSSAIVPLLIREPGTREVRAVLRSDDRMTVWWGTPIECLAAVAQGERSGEYGHADVDHARERLAGFRREWTEILPSEQVRDWAVALLVRHPLRSADALQLGAALTWARGHPRGRLLYTLDGRLADAARREGFTLPSPGR